MLVYTYTFCMIWKLFSPNLIPHKKDYFAATIATNGSILFEIWLPFDSLLSLFELLLKVNISRMLIISILRTFPDWYIITQMLVVQLTAEQNKK